ncbi:TPA: hypothetical protein ACXIJH_005202, partial [Serratia marcescens]
SKIGKPAETSTEGTTTLPEGDGSNPPIIPVSKSTSIPQFQNDFVTNAGKVFRYDTRPPSEILKNGFEGTRDTNHLLDTFSENTVFSSRTRDGAEAFKKSAEDAGVSTKWYLYEVDANESRAFSVKDAIEKRPTEITKAITKNQIEKNFNEYSKTKKYTNDGPEKFFDYIYSKVHDSIDVFLKVDEMHIEGPIPANKIKYIPTS